jgi:hypothetical protein
MNVLKNIKLLTILSASLFFSSYALSEALPNEFPRTVGTISKESDNAGIVIFSNTKDKDKESTANEFPATVGTVKNETGGFGINWDNTAFMNILRSLDVFGWFSSDENPEVEPQSTNNQQSVTLALANVDNKTEANKPHTSKLSEKSVPISSKKSGTNSQEEPSKKTSDSKEELQEASSLIFSQEQKSTADLVTIEVSESLPALEQKEQAAQTVAAQDDDYDWRKGREWWQRGTPVL